MKVLPIVFIFSVILTGILWMSGKAVLPLIPPPWFESELIIFGGAVFIAAIMFLIIIPFAYLLDKLDLD